MLSLPDLQRHLRHRIPAGELEEPRELGQIHDLGGQHDRALHDPALQVHGVLEVVRTHRDRLGRLVHFLLAQRLRRPLRGGVLDTAEHEPSETGTGDALGAVDPIEAPQLSDVLQPQDGRAAVLAGHGEQPAVGREGGQFLQARDLVQDHPEAAFQVRRQAQDRGGGLVAPEGQERPQEGVLISSGGEEEPRIVALIFDKAADRERLVE